jgi:hypothetical protein
MPHRNITPGFAVNVRAALPIIGKPAVSKANVSGRPHQAHLLAAICVGSTAEVRAADTVVPPAKRWSHRPQPRRLLPREHSHVGGRVAVGAGRVRQPYRAAPDTLPEALTNLPDQYRGIRFRPRARMARSGALRDRIFSSRLPQPTAVNIYEVGSAGSARLRIIQLPSPLAT